MPGEEDTAIATLGGFGLEEVLHDLNVDTSAGLRSQLGLGGSGIGYGREDLYNGKYADDGDDEDFGPRKETGGKDWEDEVDREVRREMENERNRYLAGPQTAGLGRIRGEVDDYDEDEDAEGEAEVTASAAQSPVLVRVKGEAMEEDLFTTAPPQADERLPRQLDVRELFPTFESNSILAFTDLFAGLPRKRQKVSQSTYVKVAYPPTLLKLPSTVTYLNGTRPIPPRDHARRQERLPGLLAKAHAQIRAEEGYDGSELGEGAEVGDVDAELSRIAAETLARGGEPFHLPTDSKAWEPLALGDWESSIVFGPEDAKALALREAKGLTTEERLKRPRNAEVEKGDWTKSIIWDARSRKGWRRFDGLVLSEDDPELLLQLRNHVDEETPPEDHAGPKAKSRLQSLDDPLNLSNDRLYEATREDRRKIRQTFGNLDVQHAYPATKLQLPFYKTRLTKTEARSWHRPALQFPVNLPISFSKVKQAKKKKDKAGRKLRSTADAGEVLKTTGDLSLKDTSNYVLFEYSEEAPPMISMLGMGSMIVNYYRKKDVKDEFIPSEDIGEAFVLDVNDESPFMKFGSIKSGQQLMALYNNLIRAPLFRHKPQATDFLVVRSTVDGEVNYYIRLIENLFVVGQTYPVVEVPGPGSRKLTTLMRNRLQNIAFKLCEKTPKNRIKISRLMKYFTDQTELQMRQRLKDFMEYNRKGPNQGFWMIKPSVRIPDREETFRLLTPELVTLSESVAVGQRHLLDAGYGKDTGGNEEDEKDDSKLDLEQQLAPWATTKNFLQATQNKAMLKLYGDGDPSGRGEAFSFLRVSMKEVFLREGESIEERNAEIAARPKSAHRYNVSEQQDIYKQEIERIWQAQLRSLRNPNPPELTIEDEIRARERQRDMSVIAETPFSMGAPTPGGFDLSRRGSGSPSAMSRGSSPEKDDLSAVGKRDAIGAGKALKIRRFMDGVWKTEVVRDPAVIKIYLQKRRAAEKDTAESKYGIDPDDPEKEKKVVQAQIEELKAKQAHREARQKAKEQGLPMPSRRKPQGDTTRKCGNCGQVGHMKTNRKCPRWAEFNLPGGVGSNSVPIGVAASGASALAGGPPGGLGLGGLAGLGVMTQPAATPNPE